MTKAVAKFFAAFFVAVAALAGFAAPSSAQSELLFGQSHYYSVVFRGNGEAIVYAKLVIPNPGDTPLADLSFEVPGAVPTEMAIYQMTVPAPCNRYLPMTSGMIVQPCAEYGTPNYDNSYYYGTGQAHYTKVDFTNSGNLYKFTLPNPVAANDTTAVVVAYAARGYVKDSFGLFKFDFETLKVPSRITKLQVAVDVDSDLILKGKQAVVNYAVPAAANSTGLGLAAGQADISSQEFNNTVSSIGSNGAMVKTASNLSPNESFTVKGEYAASWWRLNLFGIVMTVVIIILIIVGLWLLRRSMNKRKGKKTEAEAAKAHALVSNDWISLTNALVSFGSVVLMVLASRALPVVTSVMNRVYDPTLSMALVLAVVLFYALAIFAPGIVMASIKRNWRPFVAILIGDFLWLVIYLIVYFTLFNTGVTPPSVYPMMY
jgi:hypothetical protein